MIQNKKDMKLQSFVRVLLNISWTFDMNIISELWEYNKWEYNKWESEK